MPTWYIVLIALGVLGLLRVLLFFVPPDAIGRIVYLVTYAIPKALMVLWMKFWQILFLLFPQIIDGIIRIIVAIFNVLAAIMSSIVKLLDATPVQYLTLALVIMTVLGIKHGWFDWLKSRPKKRRLNVSRPTKPEWMSSEEWQKWRDALKDNEFQEPEPLSLGDRARVRVGLRPKNATIVPRDSEREGRCGNNVWFDDGRGNCSKPFHAAPDTIEVPASTLRSLGSTRINEIVGSSDTMTVFIPRDDYEGYEAVNCSRAFVYDKDMNPVPVPGLFTSDSRQSCRIASRR